MSRCCVTAFIGAFSGWRSSRLLQDTLNRGSMDQGKGLWSGSLVVPLPRIGPEEWVQTREGEILLDKTDLLMEEGEILLDKTDLLMEEGEILLDKTDLLMEEGEILLDKTDLLMEDAESSLVHTTAPRLALAGVYCEMLKHKPK